MGAGEGRSPSPTQYLGKCSGLVCIYGFYSPCWACPSGCSSTRAPGCLLRARQAAVALGRHEARGREERSPQSPMGKTPARGRRASWKGFIAAGIVCTWPSERCPCRRRLPAPAQSLVARCEPSRGEISHQKPPGVDLGLLRGSSPARIYFSTYLKHLQVDESDLSRITGNSRA